MAESKTLGKWVSKALAEGGGQKYHLSSVHKPYMVLPKGGSGPFSCANCKFSHADGDELHCSAPEYELYQGTTLLVAEDGKSPLDDGSRACSDWFQPKD